MTINADKSPVTGAAEADIRETVRERYADAARSAGATGSCSCCTSDPSGGSVIGGQEAVFGGALYDATEAGDAPKGAVADSLGCGVPTAVAALSPGEVVLDLGSGAGADVLISAKRVTPGGRAIGVDMTDEM